VKDGKPLPRESKPGGLSQFDDSTRSLLLEIGDLKIRPDKAEEILRSVRSGRVDSIVVSTGEGKLVYTLKGANYPYPMIVEKINKGSVKIEEHMAASVAITDLTEQKKREDRLDFEVRKRTAKLENLIVELMGQNLELRSVKQRLEEDQRALEEGTAKLEEMNKELESFSYSVSHDLREPLRAIDGYARMILKKQGDKFDDDTLRKFNDIRSNAQKMGQLIDDILALSRLGKKQMVMSNIDMDQLIRDVWKDLQAINPERNMTLTIHSMPSGYGDRMLIKQVYSNLLGNAIKFTKNRNAAHIEAGGCTEDDEDIYYVKDNGIGFDMAYYDQLFGIFQRLHSHDDFEGTGVGLATVQRIIQRHGGRVWAEGKVSEGATFYFSLP